MAPNYARIADYLAVIDALNNAVHELRALPAEAWKRVGIYSKKGERTLEQLVQKAIDYLAHHLRHLRAKRHG